MHASTREDPGEADADKEKYEIVELRPMFQIENSVLQYVPAAGNY